jgi:alpha-beta hydrolase superfamily lysophospholipase|tara:strand:+ start:4399 stop:5292 length:894 start_codon:yes stop_codon:yes gene_type:complete
MNLNTFADKKYIYRYLSKNNHINGIFHISHGMAEHIGRYNWLINKLNEDGYHVIAIDHRGHGNRVEDNLKGYFADKDGWDYVVSDLVDIIEDSSSEFPNLKQYLIGHSMGSWIALGAMQKGIDIDCCILSGSSKISKNLITLQRIIVTFLITFFGKKSIGYLLDRVILGEYNKSFSPNRTPKDWISSDKQSVDEYINDPLCGYPVTNGLWNDLLSGFLRVFDKRNYKISKNIPILIISGSHDPVGDNTKGTKKLYKFLSTIFDNIEIELINNARHEVFNEINKENNYNKLLNFIEKT